MNLQHFTTPAQLERNSFLWSEVRLVVAAVALFIGGVPPALAFNPISSLVPMIFSLLKIAWLISGAASAYLLYRWYSNGQRVFGGRDAKDRGAFLVSGISGINLGLVGLLGTNIGMSIASGSLVFGAVGAVYLVAAWHLYQRWNASHQQLF